MEKTKENIKDRGMAALAYILFFIPLFLAKRTNAFVRYHIKQGIALFVTALVVIAVSSIPFIGWLLWWPLWILMVTLVAVGVLNAMNGKEEHLPIVGKIAEKIQF